jgi:hypothetical protein
MALNSEQDSLTKKQCAWAGVLGTLDTIGDAIKMILSGLFGLVYMTGVLLVRLVELLFC